MAKIIALEIDPSEAYVLIILFSFKQVLKSLSFKSKAI